jgi:hypothetical protein
MPLDWNNGILECWNIGIRAEINNFNYKNSFKPIFPFFHHFYPACPVKPVFSFVSPG